MDATAYLLERSGDIMGAFKLILEVGLFWFIHCHCFVYNSIQGWHTILRFFEGALSLSNTKGESINRIHICMYLIACSKILPLASGCVWLLEHPLRSRITWPQCVCIGSSYWRLWSKLTPNMRQVALCQNKSDISGTFEMKHPTLSSTHRLGQASCSL